MTSHSKMLFPTSPQLMPGMSLSLCICLSWRPKSPEAAELAMLEISSLGSKCSVQELLKARKVSVYGDLHAVNLKLLSLQG